MGQRAAKLQRFLSTHPRCFFCGGEATTIDHIPSRECFENRVAPEGYEFPSCEACNHGTSQIEQAVAFYLHMTNFGKNEVSDQAKKLHRGVMNNNPELLPTVEVHTNDKRRTYRRMGITKPDNLTWDRVGVAKMPAGHLAAMETFSRKLTSALYYMHMSEILPPTNMIRTHHAQTMDRRAEGFIEYAKQNIPNGMIANRKNTDIGDQFAYLWTGDRSKSIFTFVAQLANSHYFVGLSWPEGEIYEKLEGGKLHSHPVSSRPRAPARREQ